MLKQTYPVVPLKTEPFSASWRLFIPLCRGFDAGHGRLRRYVRSFLGVADFSSGNPADLNRKMMKIATTQAFFSPFLLLPPRFSLPIGQTAIQLKHWYWNPMNNAW